MGETAKLDAAVEAALERILRGREARPPIVPLFDAEYRVRLLGEFLGRMQRLERARHTIEGYSQVIRRFYRAHPDLPLASVTREHIETWLLNQRLNPRSKQTILETLRSFLRWLTLRREIPFNPCDLVETPRKPVRLRRPAPTFEEFEAMRAVCGTLEDALVLELFFFGGFRMSELRHLRERDIELERRRVRLIGKGNKKRLVIIPERVELLLRQWLLGESDAWVFHSRDARNYRVHLRELMTLRTIRAARPLARGGHQGPRDSEYLNALLARLGEDAGLPYHVTSHILRHGFIRLCKTKGIPLEVAARLAGHANIQLTAMLYGQLDEDALQKVYDEKIGGQP